MTGPRRSPAARTAALDDMLADRSLPKGGFSRINRSAAMARLTAMGLPLHRDEYWRFTSPAALIGPVEPAPPLAAKADPLLFAGVDRLSLVFTDGAFDADASDDPALAGVEITRLAVADRADIHWARDLYGVLEATGQSPVERSLATWNTAAASDGVLIRAFGKAAKPIHLIYNHRDDRSDAVLHHCIRVEPGAELTLLETGPAAARLNLVTEVDVMADGRFHHVRAQGRDHARRAVTHIFARVAASALFKSFTLSVNGALTRNEAVIDMVGDNAVAHIAGAALGDGRTGAFHHDDTIFVTHDAVGCESRQVFKKVLKNGATGVFQGKILVKPGAQKTDGYQISQALLLDEDSQFLAKPELEIYADDVKCSHGSTTGAIDETALFYLRSRGVPYEEATALLVLSFVADAIAEIDDPALAEGIVQRLESWLARRKR